MNPLILSLGAALMIGVVAYAASGELEEWSRRRRTERSLDATAQGRNRPHGENLLDRTLGGRLPLRTLQLLAGATALVFLLGVVLRSLALVLAGSLLLTLVVFAWSQRQRWALGPRIRRQLPDAIDVMASAISAGGTLFSALEAAARETPVPLGSLIRAAVRRCNVNQTVPESLAQLQLEAESPEVAALIAALDIQRTTGGNLAKLLRESAEFIREELRLRAEARALSAQARYSAVIIGLMPLFLFVLFSTLFPSYIEPLTTGGGLLVLIYCALSTAFGFLLISQIASRMETA